MVVVQVWQLGLLNRILQLGVLCYFVWTLRSELTWAYSEQPSSRINAWVEGSEAFDALTTSTSLPAYCGNSTYDFNYGRGFVYNNASCEVIHPFEVGRKLPATTVVSTSYLEIVESGWPCSAADAATRAADCVAQGGQLLTRFATQCVCLVTASTFAAGVDEMFIAFDHSFSTSDKIGLAGSSTISNDAMKTTTVVSGAASDLIFPPGETVRMRLSDMLQIANGEVA